MNPEPHPPLGPVEGAGRLARLEERLRQEREDHPGAIRPHARTGPVPLSFAQRRLWFLDRLTPGTPLYTIFTLLHLTFPVNLAVLGRCLNHIALRHEVLRTRFVVEDGEPVQVIDPTAAVPLQTLDLRRVPAGERAAEIQRLANAEARRPFDLAAGPLLRATVLQCGDADHVLLVAMHHIVSDGWSMGIFLKELGVLYQAFALGQTPPPSVEYGVRSAESGVPSGTPHSALRNPHSWPLPPLPIQYADFALWQRAWLAGEVRTRQLDYWKRQLAEVPFVQLPADGRRSAIQTFRGAAEPLEFGAEFSDDLRRLSRLEGLTLFMTLLAGFQALLSRYTGQNDIALGSPIAGRNRTEVEPLIGFFVNTLVLRTRLAPHQTFRELLRQVQKTALEAYSHQELPFEMLVEELHPERNLSRNPIFQVMFQVLNAAAVGQGGASRDASIPEVSLGTAKFDLTLSLTDAPGPLTGYLEYNTDLFSAGRIRQLITHYECLLRQAVAAPNAPLQDLQLLSPPELHRLTREWNATSRDYPRHQAVHCLFEQRAEAHPEAVAARFGDASISYGELNRWANRLAHQLLELGVQPEECVGVCLDRSLEFLASVLAILKAGAAYLPLDSGYPKPRLAAMLGDAQARFVLANRGQAGTVAEIGRDLVTLDPRDPTLETRSGVNPGLAVSGEQLACVMYTSGSTGIPKGIMIPHRAILRLVLNADYLQVRPGQRIGHASNCSFDAATFEIWSALLNGAELAGVSKEILISPLEYAGFIRQHQINALFITTALFHQMAQMAPWAFASVETVLFGGEVVEPRWVARVLGASPPQRLLNVYGPTESTTFASAFTVTELPEGRPSIPIGRPIANTTLHVLDAHLNPVPVGVPGELYIGGDGLARGYFRQPAMTAERFIPDPWSERPGARLYRTGDLAQYRPDGNLEFLGRRDHQVKLRGFRVEMGDIEAALTAHEAVEAAVVLVRKDRHEDNRLTAYVVPRKQAPLTIERLRSYLRELLPEFMVPADFILLDKLPLTPSGKIDRQALPEPDTLVRSAHGAIVPPGTESERVLAGIWTEVLSVERVGIDDSFFDLGGHSLLMARVHGRVHERLRSDLSMIDLFQYPTIRSLAGYVDSLPPAASAPAPITTDEPRSWQSAQERVARQRQALQRRSANPRNRAS